MIHFPAPHHSSPFAAKGTATDFAFLKSDGDNVELQLPREDAEVLCLAGYPATSLIQVMQGRQQAALSLVGHSKSVLNWDAA